MKILCVIALVLMTVSPCRAGGGFAPGDTLTEKEGRGASAEEMFRCEEVPDSVFEQMRGKSYKEGCNVDRGELRYLRCLHKDAEGNIIVGEMIVNKAIADDVLNILLELYKAGYPIQRMRLIDLWNADDEAAMTANNSSGFNFRPVANTKKISKHGLGMAVDINPLYNPCRRATKDGRIIVQPKSGRRYADRSKPFPYKIAKGDLCYRLFKAKGFSWGGEWRSVKDYQHFEKK